MCIIVWWNTDNKTQKNGMNYVLMYLFPPLKSAVRFCEQALRFWHQFVDVIDNNNFCIKFVAFFANNSWHLV